MPVEWVACFQLLDDGRYELSEAIRPGVSFSKGDAGTDSPAEGPFDLVLARHSSSCTFAPEDARRARRRSGACRHARDGPSDSLPQDHALQCVQGAPNGVYRCSEELQPPNDGRPATLTELLGLEERLGDQARAASQKGDGTRAAAAGFWRRRRGARTPSRNIASRTASMGVAPEPENLERPRTAVALGSTGPLPASPPRRPRSARVAPPEPAGGAAARARAEEEGPSRGGAGGALRPAAAARERAGQKRAVKSGRRDHQVGAAAGVRAPPRKSLKKTDARKVVERLYTADCARREERVQANAKAYFRPATRRRRKGKKAVRSFLSRLRRSDAKRKKRLKAIRDAVFAAERGVERTAEDAVGLQNLSRLAAARPPPPPTRAAGAARVSVGVVGPSAAVIAGVWRSARAPGASGSRGQFGGRGPSIRGTRRDAPAGPRGPRRGAHAPDGAYRMATAVGAVEVAGVAILGNYGTDRNAWTSHPSCAELMSRRTLLAPP